MDYHLFKVLGISLGLGLLVGMQREFDDHKMAGIRTFTLVTLFGSVMALVAQHFEEGLVVAAGALCLAMLMAVVNVFKQKKKPDPDIGQTTEVAFLLMYGLGAYVVFGSLSLAVVLGGLIAILLHLKSTLGEFVDNLEEKDVKAIMQFTAISLVILPVLPDSSFGPYNVINLRDIWLMVVLIVGLGLAGYILYKFLGKNAGTLANGILGGLISSTATTVTFAKRAKDFPKSSQLAAFIILAASAVAIIRVIIEVAVVTPGNLHVISPPLIAELVFMIILCLVLYYHNRGDNVSEMQDPDNPAQLKSALIFGGLYAVILLAVAVAKDYFGQSGLYIVSIISGLTDMDAITLSLSNSLNRGELDAQLTWRLIMVAALSNLVFKAGMASVLGSSKLAKVVWVMFALAIIFGILLIFFWPESFSIPI